MNSMELWYFYSRRFGVMSFRGVRSKLAELKNDRLTDIQNTNAYTLCMQAL